MNKTNDSVDEDIRVLWERSVDPEKIVVIHQGELRHARHVQEGDKAGRYRYVSDFGEHAVIEAA